MYPNPVLDGDTLRYKVVSDQKILSYIFEANSFGQIGDELNPPSYTVQEEVEGLIVNGQGGYQYSTDKFWFAVATVDSCIYEAEWQVVKK